MNKATVSSASLAVRTEKAKAESILKKAISLGILDRDRKIVKQDGYVEIPVLEVLRGGENILQDDPSFYRKRLSLEEALQGEMPSSVLHLLPKGWQILGEIIIVKISPTLDPFQDRIALALLDLYPRCCTVLRDYGIEGQLRRPTRRIIAGSKTETVHRENGVLFQLDTTQVMFSAGNLRERMRMSRLGKGEVVLDMFAGIGYFTLPMAVHSRPTVINAIELNPIAHHYLCRNIRLNQVEDIINPILGDCAKVTEKGTADRVIMGLVQVTNRYLGTGIEALRPGGTLHYHQTLPSWKYPQSCVQDVMEAATAMGRKAKILRCARIKKYSPGVVHAVVDAQID